MLTNPGKLTAAAREAEFGRLMLALHLTSHDAAETLGVTYETVRLYQRGRLAPNASSLLALMALEALPAEAREALILRRVRPSRRRVAA